MHTDYYEALASCLQQCLLKNALHILRNVVAHTWLTIMSAALMPCYEDHLHFLYVLKVFCITNKP